MDVRNRKKKRKKLTKTGVIRGLNGAISILLCLLLTPFLTIALCLIEYSRYQQVMELTDEIYELTGLSLMTNYDTYLHNRFGLLCTTQDGTFGEDADTLMADNLRLMGNQVTLNSAVSALGKLSLHDSAVLRKQVLDVSELTGLTSLISEDFKLDDLLAELEGLQEFQAVTNTVEGLTSVVDSLTDAVDALEKLQQAIVNLNTWVTDTQVIAQTLIDDMVDFYKLLGENNIVLPEDASDESITAMLESLNGSVYITELIDLYKNANELVKKITELTKDEGILDTIVKEAEAFQKAIDDAVGAADAISNAKADDKGASISAESLGALEDALDTMKEIAEGAIDDFKKTATETISKAMDDIVDIALEQTGLSGIIDRYSQIVNGEYFKWELSDLAKNDLIDLLKTVYTTYTANQGDHLVENLTNLFKEKFLVDIQNIDVSQLLNEINGVIENTDGLLEGEAKEGMISTLTALINTVKGLFDMEIFYDTDLCAYVDVPTESTSGYQSFLDAISKMLNSATSFKDALKEDGALNKLKEILKAMKSLLEAIGEMVTSLWEIVEDKIDGLKSIGDDGMNGLYEKLLIAAYMEHNLPCRTSDCNLQNQGTGIKSELNGTGLTGFNYNDIARPNTFSAFDEGEESGGGFMGLSKLINGLLEGGGNDSMFAGAELEYICAGTESEMANQAFVFLDLYFIRLVLDLPSIFITDAAEISPIATSATVAAWLVYIVYILIEPFCDVLLLVNGGSVPLIRTDCWLTPTGLPQFVQTLGENVFDADLLKEMQEMSGATDLTSGQAIQKDSNGKDGIGLMDYKTHVLILMLVFVDDNDMIDRLKNLIYLEANTYYSQNGLGAFDLSKTYTTVEITADVTFNPFFDFDTVTGGASLMPSTTIKHTLSY